MKNKTLILPPPIKQSFNHKMLLIDYLNDEDYAFIQKINGYHRFNLRGFVRQPKFIQQLANMKKAMPPQGGQVLRMRRYE